MVHALLGAHLPRRPIIRGAGHGIEPDEPHPLVIHAPVGLVEEPPPLCAHVVIPIVLAGDEDFSGLDFRQKLNPERELIGSAELS